MIVALHFLSVIKTRKLMLYGEILSNRCFLLRTVQNTEESRIVAVQPGGEKCYR